MKTIIRKVFKAFFISLLFWTTYGNAQLVYSPGADWNMSYHYSFPARDFIKKLSLASDTFSILPSGIKNFKNLEYIEISGVNGMDISKAVEILSTLPNLKGLYLYHFNNISKNIIKLSKLKEIRFTSCESMNLDTALNLLSKIESIQTVEFYTPITKLPSLISSFKNLKTVVIPSCSKNISKDFFVTLASIKSLIELRIIYSENEISEYLSLLSNVRTLRIGLRANYVDNMGKIAKLNLEKLTLYSEIIPDNIGKLSQLTELIINNENEYNYIYLVSFPDAICNLKNLTRLTLYGSRINTVPDSLGNLNKLIYLDLSHNTIRTLPDIFGKLPNLESVILNSNSLSSLPSSFYSLRNLRVLQLNDNYFGELPSGFNNFSKLDSLCLFNNRVSKFPNGLTNLKKLSYLALAESVPNLILTNDITQLISLSEVYFGFVDSIPENFSALKNLKKLSFTMQNKFKTNFDWVINLDSLITLDIAVYDTIASKKFFSSASLNKHIHSLKLYYPSNWQIPIELMQMTSLVGLEIYFGEYDRSKNNDVVIPDEIAKMKNLEYLKLENYGLKNLPNEFDQLTNLKTLYLTGNKFDSIPECIFKLLKIEKIILPSNNIVQFPTQLFDLPSLYYIDLRGNKIKLLPSNSKNIDQVILF